MKLFTAISLPRRSLRSACHEGRSRGVTATGFQTR